MKLWITSAAYVTILEDPEAYPAAFLVAFLVALPGASALEEFFEGLQPVGSWIQPAASEDP